MFVVQKKYNRNRIEISRSGGTPRPVHYIRLSFASAFFLSLLSVTTTTDLIILLFGLRVTTITLASACASTSITSKATNCRDYPPMNRQYLDCRCALYPDGHSVPKTEKLKHTLELKNARIRVSLFYMILSPLFQLEVVELESSRSMLRNVHHYPKPSLQRHIPWIWMN
jgi:hypothetical protein